MQENKWKITIDAEDNILKHLRARVNVNSRGYKLPEQLTIIEYCEILKI